MKELTKEQYELEFKRIEESNMTLESYIATTRVGATFPMNRKTKREVYSAYTYNKEIASLYESRCHDLFNDNTNHGLSQNGMIAYNAICEYRDEVMYLDA